MRRQIIAGLLGVLPLLAGGPTVAEAGELVDPSRFE
jgi:hypothetical protein